MSTALRSQSALVAVALLLAGCAAVEPIGASPSPGSSTPISDPEPAALDCAALVGATYGELDLAVLDSFGDYHGIVAAEAGGISCEGVPDGTAGGLIELASVVVVPSAIAASPTAEPASCGELFDTTAGCRERIVVDDLVADIVMRGEVDDASLEEALAAVVSDVTGVLASGARPAPSARDDVGRFDCQAMDLLSEPMPEAVGVFTAGWGGTDRGAPVSELASDAGAIVGGAIGCLAVTAGDFGVALEAVKNAGARLDDAAFTGRSTVTTLGDGRSARIAAGVQAGSSSIEREDDVALIVTTAADALLIIHVARRESASDSVAITDAAVMIAEGVVRAAEAAG